MFLIRTSQARYYCRPGDREAHFGDIGEAFLFTSQSEAETIARISQEVQDSIGSGVTLSVVPQTDQS